MSNPFSLSMNVTSLENAQNINTPLIGLKCQSMRSKVHCTNKTLHKNRKNVKDHASPRVACTENLTLPKVYSRVRNFQCPDQPRSQGLSSLPPLSLREDNDNGGREERPWERGCVLIYQKKIFTIDYTMFISRRLISPITAAVRRGRPA